jgi:hypothetical protein
MSDGRMRRPRAGWAYAAALLAVGPLVLGGIALAARAERLRSATAMAEAATKFLESLPAAQRTAATFRLDDAEREDWGYVPRSRRGVPLGELSPRSRELAMALVRSGLSENGYRKAQDVVRLEGVLREIQGAYRDPALYYFSIFGEPAGSAPWGWRLEGHHLSLNYTVVDGDGVAHSPSFFGANPATVRSGALTGLRALGPEEDLARELVKSLDSAQRKRAIFADRAPSEIVTGDDRRVDPLAPAGIPARELTEAQRATLTRLLDEYLARMPEDVAAVRRAAIVANGVPDVAFAWAGGLEPGLGHYYRVQGPTFVVEYDNTQNGANHVHTVWRDFRGDFGRDLLKEHYAAVRHDSTTPIP